MIQVNFFVFEKQLLVLKEAYYAHFQVHNLI